MLVVGNPSIQVASHTTLNYSWTMMVSAVSAGIVVVKFMLTNRPLYVLNLLHGYRKVASPVSALADYKNSGQPNSRPF